MKKKNFKLLVFSFLILFFVNIYFSLFYKLNLKKFFDVNDSSTQIFFKIRLPRTLATFFVGGGLAVVGCVLQSIFFNPLCESYTLGISSAAGFGVIFFAILGLQINRFISSFFGIIVSLGTVYLLLNLFKNYIDITFVLAGIVLNFLFSSITLLFTFYVAPYKVHYVLLWLLGSFSSLDAKFVYFSCILIFLCYLYFYINATKIDIITLGNEKSISLGVEPEIIKKKLLLVVIIISAIIVSLVGVVSFVGILVPNVIKKVVGLKHKVCILLSSLLGGVLVMLCDNLSRYIFYPIEIPLSIFTGIIGSIFFIVYLLKWNLYGNIKN
ncbi:MAG: iron ABC transporter permease [Endomicrobia bacterium]|nr:iron ABC transporter permease [Endomicrobiia bacterium]